MWPPSGSGVAAVMLLASSAAELADRLRNLDRCRSEREAERKLRTDAENAQRRRRQFIGISTAGVILTILVVVIAIRENMRAEEQARLREMAVPSTWSVSQPRPSRHAPRLGEHSIEVLREVGYSDEHIATLVDSGVTATPPE